MTQDGLCKLSNQPLGWSLPDALYLVLGSSAEPKTLAVVRFRRILTFGGPESSHPHLGALAKIPCDDHPRNNGAKPLAVPHQPPILGSHKFVLYYFYSGTIGEAEAASIPPLHKLGCIRRAIHTSMHSPACSLFSEQLLSKNYTKTAYS